MIRGVGEEDFVGQRVNVAGQDAAELFQQNFSGRASARHVDTCDVMKEKVLVSIIKRVIKLSIYKQSVSILAIVSDISVLK